MTLEQIQRHKVRLSDAWRESRAQYGFAQAVNDGFYKVVADCSANGFVPRDLWLTHQLSHCLDEAIAREAHLIKASAKNSGI